MNALLLIIIMLCGPTQNAATKSYLQKTNNKGTYVFSIMSMAAEIIFYTATSGGELEFFLALTPWSAGIALGYGLATLFSYFALDLWLHGPDLSDPVLLPHTAHLFRHPVFG